MAINVKEIFKHRSRICVVVEITKKYNINPYCNGYVSTQNQHKGRNYDDFINRINCEELTYSGDLSHLKLKHVLMTKNMWFLGFDSMHFWNIKNPVTQTFEKVKERTIKLADEMIQKGI